MTRQKGIHETKEKSKKHHLFSRKNSVPKVSPRFSDDRSRDCNHVFLSFLFPRQNNYRSAKSKNHNG
jgi:hypothetical protein